MDITQEAKEELSIMKSAIETFGYLHIDEEKAGKLIGLISRLVDRLEWKSIESAPYDVAILGIVITKPDNDQLKGIEEGWLHMPRLPFVCKRIPETEDYDEMYMTVSMYGLPEDEDCAPPTYWLPLPPVGDK